MYVILALGRVSALRAYRAILDSSDSKEASYSRSIDSSTTTTREREGRIPYISFSHYCGNKIHEVTVTIKPDYSPLELSITLERILLSAL